MEFSVPLDRVFSAPTNVKVLRVLFNTDLDLTGRGIAEFAGLDPATCNVALNRLNGLRIIESRKVGASKLYRLKSDHLLVKELLAPLFAGERKLLTIQMQTIASRFSHLGTTVILFGSVAREEATKDSDLDICLVVDQTEHWDRVREIADTEVSRLSYVTGVVPTFLIVRRDDFVARFRNREKLILSIVKDGKVFGGLPLEKLVAPRGR